jgi:precorrin-2 dehydrogenase/sirohydrochlorin ferrochelatase
MTARLYPLFLNLKDRMCVVVGGSEIAEHKTRELLDAGARVRLTASTATDQISAWAKSGKLQWEARAYERHDLREVFLVVSVADKETNARVFSDAEAQQTFCNSVDNTAHCNCYASAVLRRGPLQIAISTAGNSPALAQRLRKKLEEQFDEKYGPWVRKLGEIRNKMFQDKALNAETRRAMLHEQASAASFEAFRLSYECESHNSAGCTGDSRKSSRKGML